MKPLEIDLRSYWLNLAYCIPFIGFINYLGFGYETDDKFYRDSANGLNGFLACYLLCHMLMLHYAKKYGITFKK